jgi:hypothetical protein
MLTGILGMGGVGGFGGLLAKAYADQINRNCFIARGETKTASGLKSSLMKKSQPFQYCFLSSNNRKT